MAGPLMERGIDVELTSVQVSAPYVAMTPGGDAPFRRRHRRPAGRARRLRPGRARDRARRERRRLLPRRRRDHRRQRHRRGPRWRSIQGDVAFVEVLERMGARVERAERGIAVAGTGELHGVDVDMSGISDTAQTLAAVAVFADSPTRVRGIGFIRARRPTGSPRSSPSSSAPASTRVPTPTASRSRPAGRHGRRASPPTTTTGWR